MAISGQATKNAINSYACCINPQDHVVNQILSELLVEFESDAHALGLTPESLKAQIESSVVEENAS